MTDAFRHIPKIDRLLQRADVGELAARYGHPYAVQTCRSIANELRTRLASDPGEDPAQLVEKVAECVIDDARLNPSQEVINGSGVILHTNLGRAPYGRELLAETFEHLSGPYSVELDLVDGKRGVRGRFVRETLARICHAEDALVVNNNAAAVLLALSALAAGREVLVSRGELIQIGGGFRIPDVIQQGGARLKEVGSTNVTTLDDYRAGIGPETGALLKVHLSNFYQGGFCQRPETSELAQLKSASLPLIEDLGSGCLVERIGEQVMPDPLPSRVIDDGADLVCFSGDKLLGGPQAGLLAGRKDLIQRLAKHPLMRAVRPDKFQYAMLQTVLGHYEKNEAEHMAPWRQIRQSRPQIIARIEAFRNRHSLDSKRFPIVLTLGEFGAGSLPGRTIESAALQLPAKQPDELAQRLRRSKPPVIGVIRNNSLHIDFLAIEPEQEDPLAQALLQATGEA